MADDEDNFFAGLDQRAVEPFAAPADDGANFFAQFDEDPKTTDPLGAFMRSAGLNVLPAIGGLGGAGAGATAGAAAGSIFPGPGTVVGAILGGIGGSLLGSTAVATTQEYALDAMPADWVDFMGQSDEQRALDYTQQPTASFLGGMLPYALTMKPGGFGSQLPANATTYQRIAANPITGRIFGGAVNGGMEIGTELAQQGEVDWRNVGIATGFGMVFNAPNRIGAKLTSVGENAVTRLGVKSPLRSEPTVAAAGDAKVMGPGVTEEVFMGTQAQSPETMMAAQDSARTERALTTEQAPARDVRGTARQLEPELFGAYDALSTQRDDLRARLAALSRPDDEALGDLISTRDGIQTRLDELTAGRSGYAGGSQARKLRAELRTANAAIEAAQGRREAMDAGTGVPDDAEMAALRQQIMAVDTQMRDMAPQVSAAMRRAADYAGSEIITPEPVVQPSEVAGQEVPEAARGPSIDEHISQIAEMVTRDLIAAGRPEAEARASGLLIGRRYATRAQRLGRTDAFGLYESEGPNIRAGGQRAVSPEQELAQRPNTLDQSAPAIDTPEFANWFGASKVVDENGAPRIAYHGSARDFEAFDLDRSGSGSGTEAERAIFLSTDPATASHYADVQGAGFGVDNPTADHGGAVYPVYVKAENPFISQMTYYNSREFAAEIAKAKAAGHDSIMFPGIEYQGERGAIAVFDPTQIKSVNNRGTFDPADPRILMQAKRGSITLAEGQRPLIKLFEKADSSTFLHESGHQWLEELIRDARTEGVSDVVKADDATVRKWLGMKDDATKPTTRQHEKFARGFEQYMREGVAPSAALARVFSQFKTWLMDIYRSIRGLGAPINEDIRAVFDRLIELEPERTVIAPEIEATGGMARTHENDAMTAEPAEAEAALDRVIAERNRSITELPVEVQDELNAALAEQAAADALARGEAGPGAGGTDEVVAPGVGAEPVPAGGGGGGESGGEFGGSGAAGGEGAGVAGRPDAGGIPGTGLRDQRSGAADAARPNSLAPSATDLFGPAESPFTDKAGNVRLENLTNAEDVRKAIRDSAAENNDFIGDRRGVITDGQVMDLADALGMDAEQLNQRQVGQAFNAEQIIAARKLLIESATSVSALAKRVADMGTDADVLAYAQARARHRMIQGHIAGITAEAGRALRAFRNIAGEMDQARTLDQLMRDSSARTLFQMREEAALAAQLDTPQKLSKFMNDAEKPGFGRMLQEYWINALVSGPRTHVTNIVSNALFAVQKMGPETLAAAGIGAIRRRMGRKGEIIHPGEVVQQFRRTGAAMPVAIKAAIDAMKAGKGVELPSDKPDAAVLQPGSDLAPAPKLDETATWADVAPEVFGLMRGLADATQAIGKLVTTGGEAGAPLIGLKRSPLGAIPDIQVRGTTVAPVGTVVRIPTRFLAASDSFFRALVFSAEKGSIAYRRATEEGLVGAARDARIAQIYQNPDAEIMERAADVASELTFTNRDSAFVKAFSRFANTPVVGMPIVKFVTPFINTPSNIISQTALHRTPLGLFSPEIRADLTGKNGNIAQDTAMAKMMVGSAYAIGFGLLSAQGMLNGSGPEDDNEKALWRLTGNQANSIKIADTWYDIRALGPVGLLASISADLYGVAGAVEEDGMTGAVSALQNAFIQNILNASFMTGPSDLLQAVQDPERYGRQYVEKFISSFVPAALAQPARAMDPNLRDVRELTDALRNRVPWMGQDLAPRIDIWGETIPSGSAFGPAGLSPIYTSKMTTDPVNILLSQLGYWPGAASRKIRGVELTQEQYVQYATWAGRMAKQRLDVIVTSPQFAQWPPQAKHDVIVETIRQSREVARNMAMGRWPQIAADAVKLKLAPLGDE